jgi:hypothetical protein
VLNVNSQLSKYKIQVKNEYHEPVVLRREAEKKEENEKKGMYQA